MGEPAVGRFHAVSYQRHAEAFSSWRVTTADGGVAERVAEVLGGVPRRLKAGGGGWEVATDAASVPVAVEWAGTTLGFCLKGCSGLGRFQFSPEPWTLAEITRTCTRNGAAGVGGRDAGPHLIIKRVQVRTLTGVLVAHLVPLLLLPAE